jgi:hypothetical protein
MALNKKTRFAFTLFLCAVLLGMTSFIWAAPIRTFHVATNGDDTAVGSSSRPWRTLQRAAQGVQPGDLIVARPGRYVGCSDGIASRTAQRPIPLPSEVNRGPSSTPA